MAEQDATNTGQPDDFSPEDLAWDDPAVVALGNIEGALGAIDTAPLTTRERARLNEIVEDVDLLETLVFKRRLAEEEAAQRDAGYETFEADVYFHESNQKAWYFVSFDAHDTAVSALTERLEAQLGEDYERAVDPGEKVYVGRVSYTLDPDDEVSSWHFNRLPATGLGVPLDGLSYDEEGGIDI